MAFTKTEALRAVEILTPYFPFCEARKIGNLPEDAYFIRTYGEPLDINSPGDIGRYITRLIRPDQEAV